MGYVKLAFMGATSAAVVVVLTYLAVRSPEIPDIPSGTAQKFDAPLIKRGADLAALGDCNTCHTAEGGKTFAGGRDIPTPFGTIYSTNITPDPETGIGSWSEEAFQRAMRRLEYDVLAQGPLHA